MSTPYHFEIPPIYQVKKSFANFTLYLNINSHNTIEGLFFTGPADSPWLAAFSELCQLCEGQRLSYHFPGDLKLASPVPGWNLPLWLLRATSRELFQNLPPRHQLLGHRSEELICRCFGVYLPQILPFRGLKQVTDETRAGGGCTRCRRQIEAVVGTSIPSTEHFDKMRELTAVFIKHNFPSTTVKLTGMNGHRIKAIFSGEEDKKDKILQSVETLIAQNFQVDVTLDCP